MYLWLNADPTLFYGCLFRRSRTGLAAGAKNKWQGKHVVLTFFECLGTHIQLLRSTAMWWARQENAQLYSVYNESWLHYFCRFDISECPFWQIFTKHRSPLSDSADDDDCGGLVRMGVSESGAFSGRGRRSELSSLFSSSDTKFTLIVFPILDPTHHALFPNDESSIST